MQGRSELVRTRSEPQRTIKQKKTWGNLEWDLWSDKLWHQDTGMIEDLGKNCKV